MARILIIEDERDLAKLLSFNLEMEGYQTTLAFDGLVGLELARQEIPDLIILDLMLPGMNGIEICKILRKQETTAQILIIMVTANSEEIDKVAGFEVGTDDYMVKPFSTRELILRIKALLKRVHSDNPEGIAPQGECKRYRDCPYSY